MNKKIFYWLIILVSLYSCTSKTIDKEAQATNDSIQKYLDLADDHTIAFNKRIQHNDKAYSMIDLNRNDTLTRYYLCCISYKYSCFIRNNALKSTAEKLMTMSLKSNDSLNIGRAYRYLGLYYIAISDNEKAIEYFFKSKKIFYSLKRLDLVIKTMDNIATTQYYASDFLGSNKTCVEMISLSTKANFYKLNSAALINIGDNLSALNNYIEAINYYKKVLKELENNISPNDIYNSISDRYISLKQYDSASKYVKINLNNKKLLSTNPTAYSTAICLNALIKLENGEYNELEQEFNLADAYFKKLNSQSGGNYNQMYLSMYYEKIKDTKNAVKAAKKALSLSKSYNNPSDILVSLEQLIKVDKKNASTNAQEYIRINDSMQISERNFRDKFARIAYETDEITQEKDKAINQRWIVTAIATIVILLVLLLLIITHQRAKQKEFQLLHEQQKANEEIYDLMLVQKSKEELARQSEKKRIALELHDGVMNKLASTRLNLNVLTHKNDAETIKKCISQVTGIYEIEQEIRNIAHDLTLVSFTTAGNSLVSLLYDFVKTQNETSLTDYNLEMDETINWERISSSIKMNLFRIVQEASHNINKFAQAENATISLVKDENNICLSITDDGEGFDSEAINEGIGLKNIKQRVETLNGKIVIQSIKNKSTSINIAIPFA